MDNFCFQGHARIARQCVTLAVLLVYPTLARSKFAPSSVSVHWLSYHFRNSHACINNYNALESICKHIWCKYKYIVYSVVAVDFCMNAARDNKENG